jgi:hypothetical protein
MTAGRDSLFWVMAGLAPASHVLEAAKKEDVDARHKAGHDEREVRAHFPFAILRQCCHAASIRFSVASGVRNAEWADSVTFGSFVKG